MTKEELKIEIDKAVRTALDRVPMDTSAMSGHYYGRVITPMVHDIVLQYTHYLSAPSSFARHATEACDIATGLMDALWFAGYARELMSREKFNDQVGSIFYEICYPISRDVRDSDELIDNWTLLDLEKEAGL